MGSGVWSTDVYDAARGYRAATGAGAFAYTESGAVTTHPDLDPYGVARRESRDGDEHPESLAIAVLFDVTGSMGTVPRVLQAKLPNLLGLLMRKGYVEHPQIMFGAVGDATCDRAPLQIGQFESDNRMDDDLGKILLEGGGGGQMTESYELAMYFMARHTAIDCFEKRGRRGYLFMIGDEFAYPRVDRRQVAKVIGDRLAENLRTEDIVAELRRRYEVYFIIPGGGYHSADSRLRDFWRGLLGQHVLFLDDLDAVCETIALTIGLSEEAIELREGLEHLAEVGSDAGPSVSRALADLASRRGPALDPAVASGSAADSAPGSAAGPATGPVTGSVAGREAGSVTGPVVGREAGSAAGPVTGSVAGREVGSAAGPVTGPAMGPAAGPVTGEVTGPAAGREAGSAAGSLAPGLDGGRPSGHTRLR